jgi:DNA-binding MarR family transcriptional regulator
MQSKGEVGRCDRERDLLMALLAAHQRVVDALDDELSRCGGLGLGEFLVLDRLIEEPEGRLRLSELAEAASVSRSALSRRVDRLVEASWVERRGCPTDRRGTYAVITETGRELVDRVRPCFQEALARLLGPRLCDAELQSAVALIRQLASALEPVASSTRSATSAVSDAGATP